MKSELKTANPVYEGGVEDCGKGAWNLFVKNGRKGTIVNIVFIPEGPHILYFPVGADLGTPAQNLGVRPRDKSSYFPSLTLGEAMENPTFEDWTDRAKEIFDSQD